MTQSGWRPLEKPPRASVLAPLVVTPFTRFARVHALSSFADGLVTIALAGSIFFSVDPNAARNKVALYLFLTIAPFAVVTPLIGPAVDRARGGRRTMVMLTTFGRALVAFMMVGHIHSLFLFPEAFAMLVLQRAYSIANRALVPKLVDFEHQLVEANSKLALLSAVGSMGGAAVGGLFSLIGGPGWSAAFGFVVFVVAGIAALQLPALAVAEVPADAEERRELRGSNIVLSSSAMAVLRGIVGFMTFLLAFEFRGGKEGVDVKPLGAAVGASTAIVRKIDITGDPRAPAWYFGAVVVGAGIGSLVGARVAPALRRRVPEEHIVFATLAAVAAVAGFATFTDGILGAFLLSTMVAFGASAGKLAFDSLVQRDAPDANYGRSFARFEARFQLSWVIGAFIPVILPFGIRLGFLLVTVAATAAAVSYVFGVRSARKGPPATDFTLLVDDEAPSMMTVKRSPAEAPVAPTDETRVFGIDPTLIAGAGTAPGEPAAPSAAEPTTPRLNPDTPPAAIDVPHAETPPPSGWGSTKIGPVISAGEGVQVERDN